MAAPGLVQIQDHGTIYVLRDSILMGGSPNFPDKTIDQVAAGRERVTKSLRPR
jgi:hypothetical protein